MTLRSRLIFSYLALLLALFCIAAISIWSIVGWSRAAGKLSTVYAKSIEAERFRANINRQLSYAFNFINGEAEMERRFWEVQSTAERIFAKLKEGADSQVELDHIEGLEETQYELVWIMKNFFAQYRGRNSEAEQKNSRARLEEISDEVADDMAAINQFYRQQENRSLADANSAGQITTFVISGALIFGIVQLLIFVFVLQRWLAMPIAMIGNTLKEISAGKFESDTKIKSADEWGRMAADIGRMARSLQTTQQRLLSQERLAALGEAASFTAHNLRNPLAGIRAAAQFACDEQIGSGKETAETFREIIKSVDRLDDWIKRFLEFSRPLSIQQEKTDINRLVTQAISIARNSCAPKKDGADSRQPAGISDFELKMELASDIPPINVDTILLEQAVFVIVANSIEAVRSTGNRNRAVPGHQPTGLVTVATSFDQNDGESAWANIVITDNGGGVPEQIRGRLFQPFVSLKEGGTGLGLAQAKKITDIHGGKISIDHLRDGTRVRIKLPAGTVTGI
jgi:signal transduction histidine kinase